MARCGSAPLGLLISLTLRFGRFSFRYAARNFFPVLHLRANHLVSSPARIFVCHKNTDALRILIAEVPP